LPQDAEPWFFARAWKRDRAIVRLRAASARAAAKLADRFDDPELAILSRLSLAQAHAREGHATEAAMRLVSTPIEIGI
jgi:hypothetical protein